MMMGRWVYHVLVSVQLLGVMEGKSVIRVALTGARINAPGVHGVGPIRSRRRARLQQKTAGMGDQCKRDRKSSTKVARGSQHRWCPWCTRRRKVM